MLKLNNVLSKRVDTLEMYNAEGTDEFIILHNKTLTSKTVLKQ